MQKSSISTLTIKMKIFELLCVFHMALVSCHAFVSNPRISSSLVTALNDSKQTEYNIVVEMTGGTKSVLLAHKSPSLSTPGLSRGEIASTLGRRLAFYSKTQQKDVIAELSSKSGTVSYSTSWISNFVFVRIRDSSKGAAELIEKLSNLPNVATIVSNNGWNIDKIGAASFWKEDNIGKGIIVGHIDSGVRHTHITLRDNWVGGPAGWFDPRDRSSTPHDANGHGTHTLATAVGSEGIGVAPGAKWTSCIGAYEDSSGSEEYFAACGAFMFCPTDPINGENCSSIPNIVTNSWGFEGGDASYDSVIQAWTAIGIIPVFAAGNSGPLCGSLGSPGDHGDVISVGATNVNDFLTEFSSVGPSLRGSHLFKPDIIAPGSDILSASHASDTGFVEMAGTSMACPHIAGAVALILSKNPSLGFDDVKKLLSEGAERTGLSLPVAEVGNCGGVNHYTFPNHKFGHGRLEMRNITVPPKHSGGRNLLPPRAWGSLLLIFCSTFWV